MPDNAVTLTLLDPVNAPWTAKCGQCGITYENWAGSTPCCGAVAHIVESPKMGYDPDLVEENY